MKHIIEILTAAQSNYMRQFSKLKREVNFAIKEAKSNIEFLKILLQPSAELSESPSPSQLSEHLPKIIHLFRVIWLNSPYLNNVENISQLFVLLSNQVIKCCKGFINLEELFAGKTRKNIEILNKCISACEDYRKLYDKVSFITKLIFFQ